MGNSYGILGYRPLEIFLSSPLSSIKATDHARTDGPLRYNPKLP